MDLTLRTKSRGGQVTGRDLCRVSGHDPGYTVAGVLKCSRCRDVLHVDPLVQKVRRHRETTLAFWERTVIEAICNPPVKPWPFPGYLVNQQPEFLNGH